MMRYIIICLLLLVATDSYSQKDTATAVTTYYFIRHAEKDRSNPLEKNPHLTVEGHQRAQQWNAILKHVSFDAIYATDYHRTFETVQPIAIKNGLDITVYKTDNSYNKVFQEATSGKNILIVGHSNTIPYFVNAVIGNDKYLEIDDAVNGNLYIITVFDNKITDTLLTIN